MKKHSFLSFVLLLLVSFAPLKAQETPQVVTLLSTNDMHGAIDRFPRLAYMVDSLRTIYPDLILLSGGDNQTGNPVNDQYTPKGLPMVALMNAVGFDYSVVGNHEFDTSPRGFGYLSQEARFLFLCANMEAPMAAGVRYAPYAIHALPHRNVRLGIVGLVELEEDGKPASHPMWLEGFTFRQPHEVVKEYQELRKSCDAVLLVTHLGVDTDEKIAVANPWIDLIIGGHSHTYLPKPVVVGNTYITQSGSKLSHLNMMQLTLHHGAVVHKEAYSLPIDPKAGAESAEVKALVDHLNSNPYFDEVLAEASDAFVASDDLGHLMVDAWRAYTQADFAVQNNGGVRISSLRKGPITRRDILTLDPFGNNLITLELTLDEFKALLMAGLEREEEHQPLLVSGATVRYTYNKEGFCIGIDVLDEKGKPFIQKADRLYRVAYSSYVDAAYPFEHSLAAQPLEITTADALMDWLLQTKVLPSYRASAKRYRVVRE